MNKIIIQPFGLLTLNENTGVYRTQYVLNNEEIEILVDIEEVKELDFVEEFLEKYNDNFRNIIEDQKFKKLLIIKNTEWLDFNEEKIDMREFVERIKLEKIEFFNFPYMSLYYNDDDMFSGNYIIIDVKLFIDGSFNIECKIDC